MSPMIRLGIRGMILLLGGACSVVLCAAPAVNLARLQYGQQNRHHITLCAEGDFQAAFDYASAYLREYPNDLEAHYILAMAQANLGQTDAAVATIRQSLAKGLTFDRYLAGPRDLLAPLYEHDGFKAFAAGQDVLLVHGPVLGALTDRRARVWVRVASGKEVTVRAFERRIVDGRRMVGSMAAAVSAKVRPDHDHTAVIQLESLSPATEYVYFVAVDGRAVPLAPAPTFTTMPETGKASAFEVLFGGGAGFIPWNERMWTTLSGRRAAAMLLLGDNVYIDAPEVPQTQRYCYYRRQSRPEYRWFAARTPVYAIWDDHDFGKNDCVSSLALDDPPWKQDVLQVFTENFVNPGYGQGPDQPGCHFTFPIADVDFIMLDCRFYRQNPREVAVPSMLGPGQKKWLLERLQASTATFKVVASSVPWASGTKPGSRDTWDGFPQEREEIFGFIAENRIGGVVLISADRHRSDAWRITRSDGDDLHDFSSSKLTNQMSHPVMKGSLFGYNEKCSVGSLHFDTTRDDPTVTYRIVNIDGEVIESLTLKRSEMGARPGS